MRTTIELLAQARLLALEVKPLDPHLDDLLAQDPPCRYYRFLYYLARELRPDIMVELGTCTGRGAAHLAAGNPKGRVFAVDPEEHGAWRTNLAPYENAFLLRGRSDDPAILSQFPERSVGLCFVDSVHACDYVLREVELWRPKLASGGVFLFDDLRLDPGMGRVLGALPFARKGELAGLHEPFGFGYAFVN